MINKTQGLVASVAGAGAPSMRLRTPSLPPVADEVIAWLEANAGCHGWHEMTRDEGRALSQKSWQAGSATWLPQFGAGWSVWIGRSTDGSVISANFAKEGAPIGTPGGGRMLVCYSSRTSQPQTRTLGPKGRRATQIPGMHVRQDRPDWIGSGSAKDGLGLPVTILTPQEVSAVAQDFDSLVSGLRGEVVDMTTLATDVNSVTPTLRAMLDYAALAQPNDISWQNRGHLIGDWHDRIYSFSHDRLPVDLQRAQKAQADAVSLQQKLDAANTALVAANDALTNGGPANTYGASLRSQLDACNKKLTGSIQGTNVEGTMTKEDACAAAKGVCGFVSKPVVYGVGATGLVIGAAAGFFGGKMLGKK
jgi:hypothetical protein